MASDADIVSASGRVEKSCRPGRCCGSSSGPGVELSFIVKNRHLTSNQKNSIFSSASPPADDDWDEEGADSEEEEEEAAGAV